VPKKNKKVVDEEVEPKAVERENGELEEEQPPRKPFVPLNKIKRIIPFFLVAVASLVLAIAVSHFLSISGILKFGDMENSIEQTNEIAHRGDITVASDGIPTENKARSGKNDEISDVEKVEREADKRLKLQDETQVLDTAGIMSELEFLDMFEPKKQTSGSGESGSNNVLSDSVDTLGWIEREMAKLDREREDINNQKIELARDRKELQALEYQVNTALATLEQAESARVINLARLYDGMRPDAVAKLFENLNDEAVMVLLPRMKPANAAKILAIMPPKRAAKISTKMITVLEKR
jgi:flagellar motility protein MotE (MotC chaperone)